MKRTIELRIETDHVGNFKVVSHEPESGDTAIVVAGNLARQDDAEFNRKVGAEIKSWVSMGVDEDAEEIKWAYALI